MTKWAFRIAAVVLCGALAATHLHAAMTPSAPDWERVADGIIAAWVVWFGVAAWRRA